MIAANIIRQAAAEGVELALSGSGAIKASGPRGAVLRWQRVVVEHKPAIVAALSAANDAHCDSSDQETSAIASQTSGDGAIQEAYLGWYIEIAGRPAFTTVVVPEATSEWMREFYPTATRIEPIEERPRRRANETEAIELTALVGLVLGDESEAVRGEALDVALADPINAICSYRALAGKKSFPNLR